MEALFQFPVTVRDINLKANRSALIKLETYEELPDETVSKLSILSGKEAWATISVEKINPEDILDLPPLPKDAKHRTPSQRLRQLLWKLAEQEGVPREKREEYYLKQIESVIQMYMGKLDDDGLDDYAPNS